MWTILNSSCFYVAEVQNLVDKASGWHLTAQSAHIKQFESFGFAMLKLANVTMHNPCYGSYLMPYFKLNQVMEETRFTTTHYFQFGVDP